VWSYSPLSLEEFLARGDHVEVPSPKRLRTDQGRRKYEADVAAAESSARERNRYITAGIILPAVLVSFIAIGVQAKRTETSTATPPTNASHVQGVSVGFSGAPVTIDVFEDFQSTASLAFEKQVGADLDSIAQTSTRQVRYHMVAIYNASSNGNRYSARAANASICASDVSVKDFRLFHRYLFGHDGNGNQVMPAVGSHGRLDTSLITYGQDVGISGADLTTFTTCVQSEQYDATVQATTQNFTNRGYTQVPVVLVNGARLKTLTVAGLNAAVASAAEKAAAKAAADAAAAAKKKAAKPTQTATPVSSASLVPGQISASSAASSSSAASGSKAPTASASTSP
jgi:Thioredoxin